MVEFEQESPLYGTQKNWTQPVFVKTAQDLISRMDDKRSEVFNAHQGNSGLNGGQGHFVTSHLGDKNFCPFQRK